MTRKCIKCKTTFNEKKENHSTFRDSHGTKHYLCKVCQTDDAFIDNYD